ncbi:Uncharacterised protein [Raoultella planticola]|uniref:Uncharacterized protein n=1 Tax=Raoultella planticola TaxID=575 RepID=A0A485CQN9_RAOPL|nr:Uncharacterised protein [Raoultella planticola]
MTHPCFLCRDPFRLTVQKIKAWAVAGIASVKRLCFRDGLPEQQGVFRRIFNR